MNRNRTFALLSLTVAVAGLLLTMLLVGLPTLQAASPQSPATIEPTSYFPLEVGNRWVYSWTNSAYNTTPIIETILVAEEADSQYTLHAHYAQMDGKFEISTNPGYNWTNYGTRGSIISPLPAPMYMLLNYLYVPTNLFPTSFQVGDTWSGTGRRGSRIFTGTTTAVTDAATVVTGRRSYTDCLQIHTVITGSPPFGAGALDAWFAPDVGLVRLVYHHDDGALTTAELQMGPHLYTIFSPLTMKNSN